MIEEFFNSTSNDLFKRGVEQVTHHFVGVGVTALSILGKDIRADII